MFQIGVKKFLQLKNVINSLPWTYVISDINGEDVVGTFSKKKFRKTN